MKRAGQPGAHRRLSHRWGHTRVQSVVHTLTQACAPSLGRMGNELMMFFAHSSPLESWSDESCQEAQTGPPLVPQRPGHAHGRAERPGILIWEMAQGAWAARGYPKGDDQLSKT